LDFEKHSLAHDKLLPEEIVAKYAYSLHIHQRILADFRRAVCLCIFQRLYPDLARKKPPSRWEKNGATEGIAKAFCKLTIGPSRQLRKKAGPSLGVMTRNRSNNVQRVIC